MANGLVTLENNDNLFNEIIKIIKEKDVQEVVIGMPYGKDGEIGAAAKNVINFTKKLIEELHTSPMRIPLFYQDERYSTKEAEDTMRKIQVKTKRKNKVVDQIAACTILRDFMNSKYKEEVDSLIMKMEKNDEF